MGKRKPKEWVKDKNYSILLEKKLDGVYTKDIIKNNSFKRLTILHFSDFIISASLLLFLEYFWPTLETAANAFLNSIAFMLSFLWGLIKMILIPNI